MSELHLLLYLTELYEYTKDPETKKEIDKLTLFIDGCIKAVKELKKEMGITT